MKIVKKILKGLLYFVLIIIIVSFFLPSKSHLERSLVINAPAEVIYKQINNLKNWAEWSPWQHKDPNMTMVYEANVEGLGAGYSWKGNSQVGEGDLKITATIPFDSIQTTMNFNGMGKSYGAFKFTKDPAGTKVVWSMDSKGEEMPWYMKVPSKYFSLFVDKMVGPDFEQGLKNLKTQSEKAALEKPVAKEELKIEAVTTTSQIIASYRMMTNEKNISGDIGNNYARIGMFMKKNNLKQKGALLAIYHNYSPDKIDIECAVPLDKTAKGEGAVNVSEMKAGNAAKLNYYGAYDKMEGAHNAMHKWIEDNHKKMNGSPWEVYISDPMNEKDTSKWLTEIYYPFE